MATLPLPGIRYPDWLSDEQIAQIKRDPRAMAYYANQRKAEEANVAARQAAGGALDMYRTAGKTYFPDQLVEMPIELYGQLDRAGLPLPGALSRDRQGLFQIPPSPSLKAPINAAFSPSSIGQARMSALPAGYKVPQPATATAPAPQGLQMSQPQNVMFPEGFAGFAEAPEQKAASKAKAQPASQQTGALAAGGYTVKPGDQLGDIAYAFLRSSTKKKPTKDQVHTQIGKFIQELGLKEAAYGKDLPAGAVLKGVSTSLAAPRGGMAKAFGKAKKPKTPAQAQAVVSPAFKTVPGELGKRGKFAQEDAEAKILLEKETPKLGQQDFAVGTRRPALFRKQAADYGMQPRQMGEGVTQGFLQAVANRRQAEALAGAGPALSSVPETQSSALPSMTNLRRSSPTQPNAVARPTPLPALQTAGVNPSFPTAGNLEEWAQRQLALKAAKQHNPELKRRPSLRAPVKTGMGLLARDADAPDPEAINLQYGGGAWGSLAGGFSKGMPMGAQAMMRRKPTKDEELIDSLPNLSEVGPKGLVGAFLKGKERRNLYRGSRQEKRLMLGKQVHPSVPRFQHGGQVPVRGYQEGGGVDLPFEKNPQEFKHTKYTPKPHPGASPYTKEEQRWIDYNLEKSWDEPPTSVVPGSPESLYELPPDAMKRKLTSMEVGPKGPYDWLVYKDLERGGEKRSKERYILDTIAERRAKANRPSGQWEAHQQPGYRK